MNEGQIKVIADGMVKASKMGTTNALICIQKAFEAYKVVKLPVISGDGQYYYGERIPYEEDKAIQTFVDFMLVCLDEALKTFDEEDEQNENT